MTTATTERQNGSTNHEKPLPFPALEIGNYRRFRHLIVERFSRVNLIVGKNSVGKTALLEALRLYASDASPSVLIDILDSRDELVSSPENSSSLSYSLESLRPLHYGRPPLHSIGDTIYITPSDNTFQVATISIKFIRMEGRKGITGDDQYLEYEDVATLGLKGFGDGPIFLYSRGDTVVGKRILRREDHTSASKSHIEQVFVPAGALSVEAIGRLWDKIALTDRESAVLDALQIVLPDITRINLLGSSESPSTRTPKVVLRGMSEPVPLASLGEGLNRLFGLSLALTNAAGGILLVDEIDTGLHYSTLERLWELIFVISRQLNVQVFATTHSSDCIRALATVMEKQPASDAQVIRLEERAEQVFAVNMDAQELNTLLTYGIEMR